MKIAKTSWHYRFNNFNNSSFEHRFDRGRYTTCSYIRTTIASFLSAIFKGFIILIVAAFAALMVGCMIVTPISIYLGINPYDVFGFLCVVGWVIVTIGLTVAFVSDVTERCRNFQFKATERVKKEPNVFVQAVIDKHNKFCTLVTAE